MATTDMSSNLVAAEHSSLREYLFSVLTPHERSSVLLPTFNQWGFSLGAMADAALTLQAMGAQVSLAFWASETPMKDTGWTTSHRLARVFRSPALDELFERGLREAGIPEAAFCDPPIRSWRPRENLAPPKPLIRSLVREMKYRGSPLGKAIVQVRPTPDAPTAEDHEWPRRWVRSCATSYAYVYDQISELIRVRGITSVIIYNGRFLHDQAAMAAANDAGLPVLYYDMGGSDTDFELTKDSMHDWSALQTRMLSMYDKWPIEDRDEVGGAWFLNRQNHVDPRNAHFTDAQVSGTTIERPEESKLVVYFSSSSDEIVELSVDWSTYFGNQVEALKELSSLCKSAEGYYLLVRSHPHKRNKPPRDVAEWMQAVDDIAPDMHLGPFSPVDSYELMKQADIVVTYGSTTGVEAAYAGKPVIVMGPCAYDELGCAIRVQTREELSVALRNMTPGEKSGAVAYGLMMNRRGFSCTYVAKNELGIQALSGTLMVEPRLIVRHGSHLLARFNRWFLTR